MKKIVLGIFTCISMILGTKGVLRSSQANIGYAVASHVTNNGYVSAGIQGATGAAAGVGMTYAGAKIGGTWGALIGGPVGIIVGAAVGAV
jgi:hypothetical protein